jgi:outer membrane protein TolC
MRPAACLLPAALALAAAPGCAGDYDALKKDVDAYQPPPLYQALRTPAPAPPAAPATAPADASFAAAADGLRQLAAEWERTLDSGTGPEPFLPPDPERRRALAPAAADAAAAGAALADDFTLETLEQLALLRNPGVRAKERGARAAVDVFGQAEQIDAVLRRYSSLLATSMGGPGAMDAPADFPFPSVLALKGRVIAEQVRAAAEELEAARRDAVTAARRAYWEVIYLQRAGAVTAGMIDLTGSLGDSVAARYEAGKTSFQDVVRIRILRERAREELRTLAEERKNREAEIRGILALPPETPVGTPAPREVQEALPAEKDVAALALERRQELRAAAAMVRRMERMLEMVESMTYPGFDLGLSPRPRGVTLAAAETAAGGAPGSAMAPAAPTGAKAPARAQFGADESYLREIRERVAALVDEREAVRAATLLGVRSAWFELDRARRTDALYGAKVLGLSQSALEASVRGYTAGQVGFSDLLESYTGWLEASLARERARADIGIARAGLEAAAGTSALEAKANVKNGAAR